MEDVKIEMSKPERERRKWLMNVADFANVLKAFIGSNYLTIAFAFGQSGIALGIAGVMVIATLTAHCCNLIVKCKYHAIRCMIERQRTSGNSQRNSDSGRFSGLEEEMSCRISEDTPDVDDGSLKNATRNFSYGHVGQVCMGKWGLALVNISIFITQFGFCVGYYIFLGNTILSMFPLYNCSVPVTNTTLFTAIGEAEHCFGVEHMNTLNAVHVDMGNMTEIAPGILHNRKLLSFKYMERGNVSTPSASMTEDHQSTFITNSPEVAQSSSSVVSLSSVSMEMLNITTASTTFSTDNTDVTTSSLLNTTFLPFITTPASVPWMNMTKWMLLRKNNVPDLRLLVLMPSVIFIFSSLVRSIRQLGSISLLANISILVGCVSVLGFLISGFNVSHSFLWVNWKDMAIFFGLVTSSFEGIGTIIPIEASMEGNRHNFTKFLYGAVAVLACILSCFGILGYLRYGVDIEQMLNANLPNGNGLTLGVNICLCIGVLLTYPLMLYPVIELAELYLFGSGLCKPKHDAEVAEGERQALLSRKEVNKLMPGSHEVPANVASWKRNCLRIFIVLAAAGLAVLLRNYFAYISAFVGALGSTMLAYILPCLFHLKLCGPELPLAIKIKDICIIFIGICWACAGVYAVVSKIIEGTA